MAAHLPAVSLPIGLVERAAALLDPHLLATREALGELTLLVARDGVAEVLERLRDAPDLALEQLVDISAVDWPDRPDRFEVNYHLLSLRHNFRLRVKLATDEASPVPTVTHLFPVAGWYEREVFDMFGVLFAGNPDLRRILTDYGFEGHPFRKDFPLSGHYELRYSEAEQRIVQEPVTLRQDFRNFDFLSPWEGMLPGDEKAS